MPDFVDFTAEHSGIPLRINPDQVASIEACGNGPAPPHGPCQIYFNMAGGKRHEVGQAPDEAGTIAVTNALQAKLTAPAP